MLKAKNEVQKNQWYGWLRNAAMQLNAIKGSADCSDDDKEKLITIIRELQYLASSIEADPNASNGRIRPANDLKDTEEFISSVKEYFKKKTA